MTAATAKPIARLGSFVPMRPATSVAGATRIATTTQATRSLTSTIRQRGTGRARRYTIVPSSTSEPIAAVPTMTATTGRRTPMARSESSVRVTSRACSGVGSLSM